MDFGDIINVILSILSFLLAVISIITVVISLKQNNKMLEADTRPYVVSYFVYEEDTTRFYFCVKNFGRSSAIIHSLSVIPDILILKNKCSSIFEDTMIAPGQQFHFPVVFKEKDRIVSECDYIHDITISYTDCTTGKLYTEQYKVNIAYATEVGSTRSSRGNYTNIENSLYNIEKSLHFLKNRSL